MTLNDGDKDRPIVRLILIVGMSLGSLGPALASPSGSPLPPSSAAPREWVSESDREVPLKSVGTLVISNPYGPVAVQGWSLDRIRIKVRKRWTTTENQPLVMASPWPPEVKKRMDLMDVRIASQKGRIEVIGTAGQGLELGQKLQLKKTPLPILELIIRAPSHLALQIFSASNAIKVVSWNSNVDLQSKDGPIQVQDLSGKASQIVCMTCTVAGESIKGDLRVLASSGQVDLRQVRSGKLYVETTSGSVLVRDTFGDDQLVTDSGSIQVNRFSGHLEFKSHHGTVMVSEGRGGVLGSTVASDIHVEMRDWNLNEKTAIQSETGAVHVTLPSGFSGELDVGSETGKVYLGFSLVDTKNLETYGPIPPNRFKGMVGREGTDFLRVSTKSGPIWVLKGI